MLYSLGQYSLPLLHAAVMGTGGNEEGMGWRSQPLQAILMVIAFSQAIVARKPRNHPALPTQCGALGCYVLERFLSFSTEQNSDPIPSLTPQTLPSHPGAQ